MQLLLDSQHVLLAGAWRRSERGGGGKSASSAVLSVGADDSPGPGAVLLPAVRRLGHAEFAVRSGRSQHRRGGPVVHGDRYDWDPRQDAHVHDDDDGQVKYRTQDWLCGLLVRV